MTTGLVTTEERRKALILDRCGTCRVRSEPEASPQCRPSMPSVRILAGRNVSHPERIISWAIRVLTYRRMLWRHITGFATEADARIIADRILAGSGAWDAPTEGTGADGE